MFTRKWLPLVLSVLLSGGMLSIGRGGAAEPAAHWVSWRQDPCRTLIICWAGTSAETQPEARLWYQAETAAAEWQQTTSRRMPFPYLEAASVYQVELTGLQPGTTYRLAWSDPTETNPIEKDKADKDGGPVRVSTMPATNSEPIRFIVGGDTYCKEYRNDCDTAKLAREAARLNPHFAILGGDIAYTNDEVAKGQRWLDWLKVWSSTMRAPDGRTIPTVFAIGNHEAKGFDAQPVARAGAFYRLCPTTGIRGYAAVDFGDYLSVMLLDSAHTNSADGEQRDWLERSLAARVQRPHRLAVYHKPIYSGAGIGRKESQETAGLGAQSVSHPWPGLFEQYGVQVAFEHDTHLYKRTHPLRGGQSDKQGVIYLGDGGMGEHTRQPAKVENEPYLAFTAQVPHFLLGTLTGDRQTYQAITFGGQVVDEVSMEIKAAAAQPLAESLVIEKPDLAAAATATQPASEPAVRAADAIVKRVPTVLSPQGIPIPPERPAWIRRHLSGRKLLVPENYKTVTAAVAAAEAGDTIVIGPGDYREAVIIDKSIALVGHSPEQTRLRGLDKTREGDSALTIRSGCDVSISDLTVQDCDRGIFVDPAGRLDLRHVHVLNNTRDGVYMEQGAGDVHTYLFMERCLVSGTADGVDFMGGQGYLVDSVFRDNSDDGIDFDGDSGAVVYGCLFSGNRDDGIEVRLKQRTYVFAIENTFEQNGEDGFEVIDTYLPENGIYNVISLQNNRFYHNRRYALGFVDQKTEKEGSHPVSAAVFIAANEFFNPGAGNVTDNYRHAVNLNDETPRQVQVTLGEGAAARVSEHRLFTPLLVGVYDFKAMTDGSNCQDAEDVAVSSTRVYVPDDDAKLIYVVDRLTGDLLHKIPMAPIRGSDHKAKGPEGVHVIEGPHGDEKLWVSDDDGLAIYLLSLEPDTYGHLLELQSTAKLGACEGVAVIDDRMYVTRSKGVALLPTAETDKALQPTVKISSNVFGGHVAGVGVDPAGQRLFVSTNGYTSHGDWRISWRGRDKPSGIYELSPDLQTVKNVWNLGPFCDDARGVAYRDGLLYAVCGRQPYTDPKTGEQVRNGEKVFVFVVDGFRDLAAGHDVPAVRRSLPYLPLRCGH